MRYLLFPGEEARFLADLQANPRLDLVSPCEASELPSGEAFEVRRNDVFPQQLVFWVRESGPLARLGDRPAPVTPQDRVALQLNADTGGAWKEAIDLERSPVVTWSRSRWLDPDRGWIIPARLGGMAAPIKNYAPEYRRLLNSIHRSLGKGGRRLNTWDLHDDTIELNGRRLVRPRSVRAYAVTVWPEADAWIRGGGLIYHWDA